MKSVDVKDLGKIAVVMGGSSGEREVSLMSGSGVRCFVRRFLFDASRLPDGVLGFYFVRRLSEVSHQ